MKLIKISVLTTRTTANMERRFSVLTFRSTKLRNTLVSNSLDKLAQYISAERHIYYLDRNEITDLDKFLMQLNYSHLKTLKVKVDCSSLFLVTFFCACVT